jgi:hypothetical protein
LGIYSSSSKKDEKNSTKKEMSDFEFIPYTGQERRDLYERLKNYVEREMRSANNPNLAVESFNKVEFSMDNIMQVPMTGMVGSEFDAISRDLRRFKRGASVSIGETGTGAATFEAHIPAYHTRRKHRTRRHHDDDDEDESFYSSSFTQNTTPNLSKIAMAAAVLLFALVAMLMTVKESQWERIAFWNFQE